jgi:hypothetical protein
MHQKQSQGIKNAKTSWGSMPPDPPRDRTNGLAPFCSHTCLFCTPPPPPGNFQNEGLITSQNQLLAHYTNGQPGPYPARRTTGHYRCLLFKTLLYIMTQAGIFLEIFRRGGRSTERHALDLTNEYISVVSLWKTI